jgi:hypothetical protein
VSYLGILKFLSVIEIYNKMSEILNFLPLALRLLHMMKALILSFFTFLSIYIEGLETFPFPQLFFENIKMQPRYNRKSYSLIFIPRKSFNCDGQFVDKFDHRVMLHTCGGIQHWAACLF